MLSSMKKRIFLFIYLSAIWQMVTSDGIFQLRLLSFVNDEGLDQTGRCCTNPESRRCLFPCSTAFRVCLTHFQNQVDDSLGCTFGRIQTPVLGGNSFNLSASRYLRDNPIEFHFTFRWPKSFSLVIDVLHESSNDNDQSHDRLGLPETVISRLVKSSQVLPVKRRHGNWTVAEPYVHRRSKLTYEYRVVCGQNQYGHDCAKFCRPRNDHLGHYRCSSSGERLCLPGWTKGAEETYCTKAVCPGGCHADRGTCEEPNKCKCNVGWTGRDCSQCVTRPDCIHGTCNGPFECICLPGWGGSFCNQDLNYCVNNKPCRNGATCSNSGEGSYTCNCTQGFAGKNCHQEINECDSNPCQNGAECVDMKGGFKCVCPAQFSGPTCETPDIFCKADSCRNGGTCVEKDDAYSCICSPHWTGPTCDVSINQCPEDHCHNNGSCRVIKNGFECSCPIGFVGNHCESAISKCADLLCLNRGRCAEAAARGGPCNCRRCLCSARYSGSRCERKIIGNSKSNKNVHAGVVILKKSTYKSEHYVENLTETRFINLGDPKEKEFNSSQWLGICLGSAFLVLLLLIFAVCLVYHKRRKMKHSKQQKTLEHSSDEAIDARNSDVSVVTDNSSQNQVIFRERNFQKRSNSEVRLSRTSFQQQAAEKASLTDVNRYVRSKTRPSGKSTIAVNDGHCCRRYSSHFVQSMTDSFSCDAQETIPLRRPSSQSFPLSTHAMVVGNSGCRQNHLHERPRSLRCSSSRPPTYEEVCREKNELVRIGFQSSNGIAI